MELYLEEHGLLVCEVCEAEGIEDVREKDLGHYPAGSGDPQKVLAQRSDSCVGPRWARGRLRADGESEGTGAGQHVSCRSERLVGWQFRFLLHKTDSLASC